MYYDTILKSETNCDINITKVTIHRISIDWEYYNLIIDKKISTTNRKWYTRSSHTNEEHNNNSINQKLPFIWIEIMIYIHTNVKITINRKLQIIEKNESCFTRKMFIQITQKHLKRKTNIINDRSHKAAIRHY